MSENNFKDFFKENTILPTAKTCFYDYSRPDLDKKEE